MSLLTTQRIISNGLAQLQFEEVWPAIRKRNPDESVLKGLSAPKLLELRQLVRQLAVDQGRKIVIFSQWRRMLHLAHWAVSDILAEQGLREAFSPAPNRSGGERRTSSNFMTTRISGSCSPPMPAAWGSTFSAPRTAWSISSCPWNPAVLEQRIGRIYRLGQKLPIDVYNLICEQGIEARIADLVGNKQAFFKGLFDGDSDSIKFDQAGSFLSRVQKLYDPATLAAATEVGGTEEIELTDLADTELDDRVADPFDEMIEAGDESHDPVELPQPAPEPGPQAASCTEEPFATPGPAPTPAPPAPQTPPGEQRIAALPSLGEVRQLFSSLQVRRESSGNIVIEAPPETASTLGALFEGMAALLQAASQPRD